MKSPQPYIAVYEDDSGFCYSLVSRGHSMVSGHYKTPEELKEKLRFVPRILGCTWLDIRYEIPEDALPGQNPRKVDSDLEEFLEKDT